MATDPAAHEASWTSVLGPALHPAVDAALVKVFAVGRAVDTTAVDTSRKPIAATPPTQPGSYDPHVEHLEKMAGLVDAACRRDGAVRVAAP